MLRTDLPVEERYPNDLMAKDATWESDKEFGNLLMQRVVRLSGCLSRMIQHFGPMAETEDQADVLRDCKDYLLMDVGYREEDWDA